jgi:hypothetical protein
MKHLLYNKRFDTYPLIVHNPKEDNFPGPMWFNLLRVKGLLDATYLPEDVTLVTWNNLPTEGLLQEQMKKLGIPYLNLASSTSFWETNREKPRQFILRSEQIMTKYVLGLDCYDVLIVGDLSEILERFHKFGCRALFNATSCNWPPILEHQRKAAEIDTIRPFFHFNSGAFIGEKNFLVDFFQEALHDKPNPDIYPKSDQYVIKPVYFRRYPEVRIDSTCQIFQVLFLQDGGNIGNELTLLAQPPRIK